MDGLTLDQMAIFVTVAEEGSFSGAARRLRRAQSAITYGIQNLELHTGADLFDRSAYRPTLTPAGMALLPRARRVLADMADYRKQAHDLAAGIEPRLTLALDVAVPRQMVVRALGAFKEALPMVEVTMVTQPMEQTLTTLREGRADLGLVIDELIPDLAEGLARVPCGSLRFIAVAAPTHPLGRMTGPISEGGLRDHMQLMLSSGTEATGTNDFAAHAINRWRVNDLGLRHELLLAGLGWGGMPDHLVADDIASRRLVALQLDAKDGLEGWPQLTVSAARLKDRPLGPAGRWLFSRFSAP